MIAMNFLPMCVVRNMMKISILTSILLILVSCSSDKKSQRNLSWKESSNNLAKEYALSLGELSPEYVSAMGYKSFDSNTTAFSRNLDQKLYVHAYKWHKKVSEILEHELHPEYKTDVMILQESLALDMAETELDQKIGTIPFIPLTDIVLSGLEQLMFENAPQEKIKSGMDRFRSYVRGTDTAMPLADGVKAYLLEKMDKLAEKRKRGFWPLKKEIEDYLKASPLYLEQIEKLLSQRAGSEWKSDFDELKSQDLEYREFLRKKILPYARTTFNTPSEYYALKLKKRGILLSPEELIKIGHEDYQKAYKEFSELAKKIATKHQLSKNDPVSVVNFFKSKRLGSDQEILAAYLKESEELKKLVREKKLLTLDPGLDFIIRLATPAEMKSTPSPHYRGVPLVSKTNEKAQFVIPTAQGQEGIDDFTFKEAIIDLTAHEAVPGHAVQFHTMKERGVSYIRAWFASNSANTEGWGLYAEEIIYPHVEDEVKFIILQRRLWRMARMFLDPELNLGKIGHQRIEDVYVKELGFSKNWAKIEFDRYAYVYPAQAPSYYYGYKILTETKNIVSKKDNAIVDERCFNDAVLDLGLLPLKEIKYRLVRDLTCVD